MNSINHKLERVRKPRVHIKYEVEKESGVVEKELPFVVGVMGDFSGQPKQPLKSLKERKFIKIDRDNFDEVLAKQNPAVSFRVENTLENNDTELSIDLTFERLADFEPEQIVQQVPVLKALKDARDKLRDLLVKADCSTALEQILEAALQEPKKLLQLSEELDEIVVQNSSNLPQL